MCMRLVVTKGFSIFKSLSALKVMFTKENKPLSIEKAGKISAHPAS